MSLLTSYHRISARFHSSSRSLDLLNSRLYDQNGFYQIFNKDLYRCQNELLIESPFLTIKRIDTLRPILQHLRRRNIAITINTKPIDEHDPYFASQALESIGLLQELGITVLFTGGHHRKLAIIDQQILWEGSLNILSQNDSCEIMRRIESVELASQLRRFVKPLK